MTLPEFLLARIAEDQAWAEAEIFPYRWRFDEARVAADCEAKRRIIMRCEDILAGGAGEALALAQGILEDLAVAYATHPDSRKQPTREPPQDPVG